MVADQKHAATLHTDCISFLAYLRDIRKYSPHTLKNYQLDLAELSELLHSTGTERVSTAQIRRLTSQLHSRSLQARSIARHLSCWRRFFAWYSAQHDLNRNPVDGIKAPKQPKTLPKALSVDQAVQLVGSALDDSPARLADHAMFELLYSCGLRVSELVSLDVQYFQDQGYTSVSWIDLAERVVHVTGKGSKTREVPVGGAALTALKAWLAIRGAGTQALFLTGRGTRMSVRLVQQRIKTHARRLGIPSDVHPHVLRHSFASHVLQSSGDLRAVQEMLGHASLSSTQVYTALDFQHLAQIYDAAHPRAKLK